MLKPSEFIEPDLFSFFDIETAEPKKDNLEFQKCKRFGVGYMGSKNQIVKKLIPQLPSAKYFVDLFAGGCAMTHGAMLSGKYERFIANDIGDAPSLFERAIKGEFRDEKRWISREMYKELYDKDPYIRYVWSFGNKGGASNYLYSKEIEPYKKAYYYARLGDFSLFDEFAPYVKNECGDNLRSYIAKNTDKIKQDYKHWYLETQLKIKGDELQKALGATKNDLANESEKQRAYLCEALQKSGLTQSAVDKHLGTNGMAGHYFGRSQWEFPTFETYEKLKEILPLEKSYFECVNFLNALSVSLQSLESLERLQSLESLERLKSLERLQSLQSLERLKVYQGCYKGLKLPEPSECVIYCDPPYAGTEKYASGDFDHEGFYEYVCELARQGYKVFISEYWMPPERFKSVFNVEKRQLLNGLGAGKVKQEHLFVPIVSYNGNKC